MTTRTQAIASIGALAIATAVVLLFETTGRAKTSTAAQADHDHASATTGGDPGRSVAIDAEAARRIGVTYATAEMKPFSRSVRTVGSITYDETRVASVTPRTEGWVERLYVEFTGAAVRRGQPLLELYSPMLLAAQEELLLAQGLLREAGTSGSGRVRENAEALLQAARQRLSLWGVGSEQIDRIAAAGVPSRTVTIHSPASGVVVEKGIIEGARLMPGMEIFRIADLGRVWIDGEVFEKDLSLVRMGQHARVTLEAYPGAMFDAVVTYVYPSVSMESRTGRVRLELPNPGMSLRPGMYAQIELLTGDERLALTIPRTAVHYTGTRSLVFARHGNTLMPHEVTTGLVSGNEVEILDGLEAGSEVVASANFLIDAESSMGSSIASIPGIDLTPGPSGASHSGH